MTGNTLELFRNFFGAVRTIFWLWGSFLGPDGGSANFVFTGAVIFLIYGQKIL